MKLLLLIFFITCIRVGDANQKTKYIDLLPESDKQAFLDLVVRRLLKEVPEKKSKHSFSHEISNEQLDEHSDFVKKVLAEEEHNLKQDVDSGKSKKHKSAKVRVGTEQKHDTSGYIDLTLRNNPRERRFSVNNDGQPNKSNEIPVQAVYDANIKFSISTNHPFDEKRNAKNETTLKAIVSSSEEKDIQVRGVRRDTHEKNEFDTFTKIVHFEEDGNNDESHNKEDSEDVDSSSASVDDTNKQMIDHSSATAFIYESEGSEGFNNSKSEENIKDKEHFTTPDYFSEETKISTLKFTITPTTLNTPSTTTTNEIFTINTQNNTVVKQKRFIRNGVDRTVAKEINKLEDSRANKSHFEKSKIDSEAVVNDLNKESPKESNMERSTTADIIPKTEKFHENENDTIDNIDASTSTIHYEATDTISGVELDTTHYKKISTTAIDNVPNVSVSFKSMNEFLEYINDFKNGTTEEISSTESSTMKNNININSEEEIAPNIKTDITENIDASTSTTSHDTKETVNDLEMNTKARINLLTTSTENELQVPTTLKVTKEFAEHIVDANEVVTVKTLVKPKEEINITTESGAVNVGITIETLIPTITVHPFSEDTRTADNLFNEALNSSKITGNNNGTPIISGVNNLVKTLRQGLQLELENNELKDLEVLKEDHLALHSTPVAKPKEYYVYEIPANKSAFVKQNKDIEDIVLRTREEPYYVPVYNYSPEKAYFNAYNRLGPNYETSKEQMDASEKFNDHDTQSANFIALNDNEALRKFKFDRNFHEKINRVPKIMASNKNINFKLPSIAKKKKVVNFHDYLDMDYYFGRTRQSEDGQCKSKEIDVTESFEKNHNPYNNMKFDTPKEYIREARQFLIRDQAFGFLDNPYRPPSNEESDIQSDDDAPLKNNSDYVILYPDSDTQIFLRNSNPKSSDISIDYYFSINNNNEKETLRFAKHNDKKVSTKRKTKKRVENQDINEDKYKHLQNKTGTIREILAMSEPSEVFNNLERLLQLNISLGRKDDGKKLKPYLNAIRDMIEFDNKALVLYDWLGTTVDILAAVKKIIFLIQVSQSGRKLNPLDAELLKYIVYLHQASKADIDDRLFEYKEQMEKEDDNIVRLKTQEKYLQPRKKTKERPNYPYSKELIDRVWLYLIGKPVKSNRKMQMRLNELQNFFEDLREALYDFHIVIKNIAMVTKYNKQKWFKNIKELYLKDLHQKQCLEVLLHISAARLLGLVEDSVGQNLGDNYLRYIEDHKKDVDRSKEELMFIMQVMKELKIL